MFQVLLVCTGNTCRSPMAEGILKSLLPADLAGQVTVVSAGTGASDGEPAAVYAQETTGTRGIDLKTHRSRRLSAELVRASDLILGMEPNHVAHVKELAPEAAERVHLITEQGAENAAPGVGVRDPIGGGPDDYVDSFNRMRSHLLRWLPVIREAVERRQGVR
jgi:protein-tyrosine-phosphatase